MLRFLKQKNFYITLGLIIVFFLVGILIGINKKVSIENILNIENMETPQEISVDFEPFWKTWNILKQKYPNSDKISDQQKIYGAISGLVESYEDPYSSFYNPQESKEFEEDISGSFSGIGLEVGMKDKILTAIAPLKNSPAYHAGIKSGDKLIKIDETFTSDLSIEEAVDLIRGKENTSVKLTILREDEKKPKEIEIIRQIIQIPVIETELREDNIFIIRIYSFTANSAKLFKDALKEFTQKNTNKLIIDLRGNPGGYLESAISMASWFLPAGKIIAIEDYGTNSKSKNYRSYGYDIFSDKLKLVILIDGGSASASEIIAGALQDYQKAIIVGEKSFGKGSVQEVINITPDTLLKITIAKWLTPHGNSISEKGLTPDYLVEYTKEDLKIKKDPQLEKAVELLNN